MLSSRDFCRRSVVFPRLGCNFRFNAHLRDSLNWQNQPEIAPKTAQNNDPSKKALADLMFPLAIVNFTVFSASNWLHLQRKHSPSIRLLFKFSNLVIRRQGVAITPIYISNAVNSRSTVFHCFVSILLENPLFSQSEKNWQGRQQSDKMSKVGNKVDKVSDKMSKVQNGQSNWKCKNKDFVSSIRLTSSTSRDLVNVIHFRDVQ